MPQHDDDTKKSTGLIFKGKELETGSGFIMPPELPKAGRPYVTSDNEKVNIVIQQVRKGTTKAKTALDAIESDKQEHVRNTNVERMRKKVRKGLK